MAFSHDKYRLENADIKRIVDTKRNTPKPIFRPRVAPTPAQPNLSSVISGFFSRLLKLGAPETPAPTAVSAIQNESDIDRIWPEVLKRKNEMISLKLTCKDSTSSFYVGTYHMPCVFRVPEVMAIHAALASQHLCALASDTNDLVADQNQEKEKYEDGKKEPSLADLVANSSVDQPHTVDEARSTPRKGRVLPYILAGDFNIKPDSSVYHLLTQGALPSSSTEIIKPSKPGDKWY